MPKKHGGARPSTGRKKGSLNAATKARLAIVEKEAAEQGITPLEVMLKAMRMHVDRDERVAAASVAKDAAPDGTPATVHRTYLGQDGRKAAVEAPRRLMPSTVPKGSAVRLGEPVSGVLGIAEGIETAFAAANG